eukprot:scaffold7447_cov353-Pinguiococcus_pyrenoidosus.AAC.5
MPAQAPIGEGVRFAAELFHCNFNTAVSCGCGLAEAPADERAHACGEGCWIRLCRGLPSAGLLAWTPSPHGAARGGGVRGDADPQRRGGAGPAHRAAGECAAGGRGGPGGGDGHSVR